MTTNEAARIRLAVMVNAHDAGHELGEWLPVPVDNPAPGWESRCRLCGSSVWVGVEGAQYSLLADQCPGENDA